jgi:predicted  nucleic acid-binding Zn-ribbon protein
MSKANIKITELEGMIESNQESIQNLSSEISKNEKDLSSEMAHTDKEEQVLLKNKDKIIKKVDSNYLGEYTKLFNKYGQGMASIVRQSCNSCYTQLPPQTLVEIEYDKKIITCPSCSVFLYHKTEQD